MNWGRVKTIFIILFLISDLFLLSILASSEWKQGTTSPEVIDSTVQILATNGITINPDIIPKKVNNSPYAEAENVIAGYDSFAKKLLGEDAAKVQNEAYESSSGFISFDGNSFSFSSKTELQPGNINEKDADTIATEFLSGLGFNLKSAKTHTQKTDSGYSITFENSVDDLPIFNSLVTLEVSGKNVVTATGIWFNLLGTDGPKSDPKSVASILIDSIPYFDINSGRVTINELSLGYTIPESNTYHKSAVLVPVWKLRDTAGNIYYHDARNPQ